LSIQVSIPAGAPKSRNRVSELTLGSGRAGLGPVALIASALLSSGVAALLQVSIPAAVALVSLTGVGAIVARWGLFGIASILAAVLPWMIVLGDLLPRLTTTFTAGAMTVVLLLLAAPTNDGSASAARLRLGMVMFFAPVIIGLARRPGGAEFVQAAKYLVFPFAVLAVTDGTNRQALGSLRMIALRSAAAAITVNLVLGSAGLNHSYYNAGDIQGLGGEHVIALLAGAVTVTSIAMRPTIRWAPVAAASAIATIATGVRSTLPGLLLSLLARMFKAGARARTLAVVAVIAVAVLASGVADVVVARFAHSQQTGEFQSFSSFGSGRGAVYASAVHAWWSSSPMNWTVGTGLRTISTIEQQRTGVTVGGHSDLIQVGVELGLIGLIGLVLIWSSLVSRARFRLPLLVLLPFALFNGTLEYGAPVVLALLFTASVEGERVLP
jgi:O-Antigen ligase